MLLIREKTGRISLGSSDPFTMPEIDPNYLEDRLDIATYLEGIKLVGVCVCVCVCVFVCVCIGI